LLTHVHSELKRREKLRAKEAAKAAKAAAAPAKEAAPKEKSAEEGEEELNPNVRYKEFSILYVRVY
jgi:lysyl-tRNA synthetase class 2